MDPGRALGQQVGALQRRVGDAEVGHRARVVDAHVELGDQVGRDHRAAHLRDAPDLAVVGDRHDPRHDRHVDADLARPRHEVVVEGVVEEQLRDQEARARVDLLLEVAQVRLGRLGVDVDLGEARRADRELGVLVADQLDQLARVAQPALGRGPLRLALRRVAAQREHVLDPGVAHPVQRRAQLLGRRVDAREVRHRLQAEVLLDAGDDVDRLLARCSSEPPAP